MIGVIEINVERIIKDGLCFLKGNPVLREICCCLVIIPLKFHKPSIASALQVAGLM
jgi:hypothetical protein